MCHHRAGIFATEEDLSATPNRKFGLLMGVDQSRKLLHVRSRLRYSVGAHFAQLGCNHFDQCFAVVRRKLMPYHSLCNNGRSMSSSKKLFGLEQHLLFVCHWAHNHRTYTALVAQVVTPNPRSLTISTAPFSALKKRPTLCPVMISCFFHCIGPAPHSRYRKKSPDSGRA